MGSLTRLIRYSLRRVKGYVMSKNKTGTKNIWSLNGIPEMEYCSIERAAELLQCKINDLLHFAETGSIEICIKLQQYKASIFSPMKYRSKDEWENFCENEMPELMNFGMTLRKYGVSRITPSFSIQIDDIKPNYLYEYENFEFLRKPQVFLSGLWCLIGTSDKNIYSDLASKGYITLNPLNFTLKEADFPFEPMKDETFFASSIDEHLYDNNLLIKERVKPIVRLTVNDLYITKTQINKIHSSIGQELASVSGIDEKRHYEQKEHHTQIKARENRMKINKAITLLLALYPHNPDDSTSYRTSDGRLIISRIGKCLDYHAGTLFDDTELPVKDDSRLRAIISEYLDNLGYRGE